MGYLVWLKKGKASNNFQCMTICHRCVNPVAAQEARDDLWIHLDLLIKNALISLPCTACTAPRLLEQARPPHHTAHREINRPADAARKTRRLGRSCDHTKVVGPQKSSTVSNQFCHLSWCFDNSILTIHSWWTKVTTVSDNALYSSNDNMSLSWF